MAKGHRLNTSFVPAAVRGLSGLFQAVSAVEPSLFRPLSPPLPVPNKPPRFCGRKAKWSFATGDTAVGAALRNVGLSTRASIPHYTLKR